MLYSRSLINWSCVGRKLTTKYMLEKHYPTFHASNVLLQQQYREKGFKKYSDLISCLLVAEQNNELKMKNLEVHPTTVAPIIEVNAHFNYGHSYHVLLNSLQEFSRTRRVNFIIFY